MSYPTAAFEALPHDVKGLIATTMITPIETLFWLGWNDEDIAALIAHFTEGIGKPYVGNDQATVLQDLAQRRAAWQAKKTAGNGHAGGNGHDPGPEPPAPEGDAEADAEAGTEVAGTTASAPPLEPNLTDINAHLYAIFAPNFVADYPDGWIEIATADPTAPPDDKGRKQTGPKSARHFTPFELDKAAAYAVRMNRQGRNVYVGVALRQGETGPSGRATKVNFLASSRGWGDFDKKGDDARVRAFVEQHRLAISEIVVTGTIPHVRTQVFLELTGKPSWEQVEAVNAAIRDGLGGNGDGVQNCDRIMRLAGTVSYPPPDKVARGYVPELTLLYAAGGKPGAFFRSTSNRAYRPEKLIQLLKVTGPGASATSRAASPLRPKTKKPAVTGDDGEANFWRKVNDLALENIGDWAVELFGDDAVFQKGTGAWRISSKALGRKLDEDLSIHPKGITDWGEDDQGEPGEKAARYTAIDLVIEHGNAANAKQAALWLCEQMGIEPKTLGWEGRGAGGGAGTGNPEIERLAQLSREDYENERKAAAKTLGFRVSVLDDLVGQSRQDDQVADASTDIEQINKDYALVLAGNKASVMKFEGSATKFRLLQVSAFKTWFANQIVGSGKNVVTLGDYWLSHTGRRQYSGIEFAPPGTAAYPGHYNLWQGFAVERRPGDCSKFLAHIRDNVAGGDEATFLWIIGWWAQIFQQPSIKMETALGLRGPQGAGKTKLGEVMGSLLGEAHYLLVASPRYITGQFNSHLASLLVLQGDEAFWAGDKKGEGIIKDLVSGKAHMLEYKGVDPIRIKNFIRLYVTGNAEWIVPAGFRDRRWAIFDIGEDKMQDNAYFAAIDDEMNRGGREALLDHLLKFDLSQVNRKRCCGPTLH